MATGPSARGFFRIVDPDLYLAEIGDSIDRCADDDTPLPSTPITVTALADLICWEPGPVGTSMMLYRNQAATGLGTDVETMFVILNDDGMAKYGSRDLDWDMHPHAVEAHGPVAYEESFTYVPLLSLGGEKSVENLHKRDTIAAIRTMIEFQGTIQH